MDASCLLEVPAKARTREHLRRVISARVVNDHIDSEWKNHFKLKYGSSFEYFDGASTCANAGGRCTILVFGAQFEPGATRAAIAHL